MQAQWQERPLFGGAIKSIIPHTFIDASETRQIPDNQEVFLDPNSNTSIIIEILEPTGLPLLQSGLKHFELLAQDNEAETFSITTQNQVDANKLVLVGRQKVAKFNSTVKDDIVVYLGLVVEKDTEILITMNAFEESIDLLNSFCNSVEQFRVLDYSLFQ
ncbi:hypothetical protein HDV06_001279 [Boothiomyces sp. JEL0866]|nr:hypothetical protein HDV06_001279 [Boothiomyces sp. JEL0866]